jgi:hypothetical protein
MEPLMTAIKKVAQMVLALPEFKAVNAANSTIVRPTVQANESGVLSLKCFIYIQDSSPSNVVPSGDIGGLGGLGVTGVTHDYIFEFRRRFLTPQLEFHFAPIKLDKALMLDSGSFTKTSYLRVVDESDLTVLNSLLDQYFLAADYQRVHREKYYTCLSMIMANLIHSFLSHKLLLISRHTETVKDDNPSNIDNRLVVRLCDWLASEGYIDSLIQPRQSRGNTNFAQSVIYPTDDLRRRVLDYRIVQSGSLVIIRNDDKEEIKIPIYKAVQIKVKSHTKVLEDYLRFISNVLFTLDNSEISAHGRRIFNRKIDLGGRFYASYQSISSHDRKRIQINTEKTIELDYKSLHFNILYSMAGVKLVDDPYIVDGYDRNVIKLISLQLLNTEGKEGLSHLGRMITRSGNPKQIEAFKEYAYQRLIYDEGVKKGLRVEPPYKSKSIEYHIDSIPENTDGNQLINDLLERHKAIRHLIGSKDIGLRLQNIDSNIMKEVMKTATCESIPLLFVHDSCICKYSDRARVKEIMIYTYKSFTGFIIKVTQ